MLYLIFIFLIQQSIKYSFYLSRILASVVKISPFSLLTNYPLIMYFLSFLICFVMTIIFRLLSAVSKFSHHTLWHFAWLATALLASFLLTPYVSLSSSCPLLCQILYAAFLSLMTQACCHIFLTLAVHVYAVLIRDAEFGHVS